MKFIIFSKTRSATPDHASAFKGKGKVNRAPQDSIGGAHLPLPGLELVGGEPLMSVSMQWPVHRHSEGNLWLPSQPQGITVHWLVPNYTAS